MVDYCEKNPQILGTLNPEFSRKIFDTIDFISDNHPEFDTKFKIRSLDDGIFHLLRFILVSQGLDTEKAITMYSHLDTAKKNAFLDYVYN